MRKTLLICSLLFSIFIFGENLLEKVVLNAQLYETVNFSQLKLTILDAINLTNEKDVITAYLTRMDKKIVWVVLTFNHEYGISAEEAKILWKKPLETRFFTYAVGLREAISLAVMSIGKNVLFGVYQTDSWLVGNNKNLATVSMKTPAILKIELTQEVFKKVQQEMLKRQQ
ncbi:hypothetical protein AS159_08570 [Thermotoga sp. Ku-13t]|uniref:hypothetical protein n=1 Tax=Thermotoga sp. Ku-13t TaxID=1755813 RepID=UPI0013EA0D97|nr:hypothetical protein [Thermotoga sp. Ku-13t]KAF2957698.1 hypothetical protein AS159_08570 [Thermotoga sp. Ku-13t]